MSPPDDRFPERLPAQEFLRLLNDEDRRVPELVGDAIPELALAVEGTVERLRRGGRLHYFGAGTSGRLGALDAAELPPTFGIERTLVTAHIAGGSSAFQAAAEGAEDRAEDGRQEVAGARIGEADVVVGIAASGETPYVLGAVGAARGAGAFTIGIACAAGSSLAAEVDVAIVVAVGPEVVDGSTRLKAGTAQKLVLNMLSTAVFARLGHVYQGRMLDVRPANAKLRKRAQGIVAALAGVDGAAAAEALDAAAGWPRLAVLMAARGLTREQAQAALESSGGDLDRALAGGD